MNIRVLLATVLVLGVSILLVAGCSGSSGGGSVSPQQGSTLELWLDKTTGEVVQGGEASGSEFLGRMQDATRFQVDIQDITGVHVHPSSLFPVTAENPQQFIVTDILPGSWTVHLVGLDATDQVVGSWTQSVNFTSGEVARPYGPSGYDGGYSGGYGG